MIFTCGMAVGADAASIGADSTGGSVGGVVGSLVCVTFGFDGVANRFHIPRVVTIATVAIAVCTSFQLRELGFAAIGVLSRRVLHRRHELRHHRWYCCSYSYLCVELVLVRQYY